MGGARIFVLHKKDLIRAGIIALVAIVLVVVALVVLIPGRKQEAGGASLYNPGTYSSMILLYDEPVHVRVTVSENEILQIYMTDMAELQRTFYPLFEPSMADLAQEVLHYQSAYISPNTDYPITTSILQEAVRSAINMAYVD